MSRVDYCNALLFGLTDMLLHKLQMIQNSAVGLVTVTHGRRAREIPHHTSFIQTPLAASSLPDRIQTACASVSGCSPPLFILSYVTGDIIRTDSLTEIGGSTVFDNTAVQPRPVWSADLFCVVSIIVEQSAAHHQRSRHINKIPVCAKDTYFPDCV